MILVVEDNPDDAELTLRALRTNAGTILVEVARDGREALDRVFKAARGSIEERPTLILLDLKLPKVPGLDVLRVIKNDPATRQIPVVVFTSSGEPSDIETAYQLGANSYIQEPVSFADLTQTIVGLRSYWLTLNVGAGRASRN